MVSQTVRECSLFILSSCPHYPSSLLHQLKYSEVTDFLVCLIQVPPCMWLPCVSYITCIINSNFTSPGAKKLILINLLSLCSKSKFVNSGCQSAFISEALLGQSINTSSEEEFVIFCPTCKKGYLVYKPLLSHFPCLFFFFSAKIICNFFFDFFFQVCPYKL